MFNGIRGKRTELTFAEQVQQKLSDAMYKTSRQNSVNIGMQALAEGYGLNKHIVKPTDVSYSFVGKSRDGRRMYKSGFLPDVSLETRIDEFEKRIASVFNFGAVHLDARKKKITVQGDKFTAKKNIYGDNASSSEEFHAKINSLYDMADILENSVYVQRSPLLEIEPSVLGEKPKNDAHKNVKYWYQFESKIYLDNVPFDVVFSIRDKGDSQYQYSIEFKKRGTSSVSNTIPKQNLLLSNKSSSIKNITQNTSNVKPENDGTKQYAKVGIDTVQADVIKSNQKSANDVFVNHEEQVLSIADSLRGMPGILYNNGATIKIPNSDMEVLRHTFKTAEHYSNRTEGLLDCIACSGRKDTKHYFYLFYKGDGGTVAPIFRLDFNYLDNYSGEIEFVLKEMGYEVDEFIKTQSDRSTQANDSVVDEIRNSKRRYSANIISLPEGTGYTKTSGLYNRTGRQGTTADEISSSRVSDGWAEERVTDLNKQYMIPLNAEIEAEHRKQMESIAVFVDVV